MNYEINTEYFWYHEGFIYTTIDVSEELLDKLIVFKDDLDANLVIEDNTRNTSDNILKQIYLQCPNIINDRRLFKAYLSDYFYENKTLLNVLLLSFDEGIPQEIAQTKTNDSLLLARMKKKLIISYAISDSIADQVIKMWVEAILEEPLLIDNNALNIEQFRMDLKNLINNNDLELSEMERKVLIFKWGIDILDKSIDAPRSSKDICDHCHLQIKSYATKYGELSKKAYYCLKSKGRDYTDLLLKLNVIKKSDIV